MPSFIQTAVSYLLATSCISAFKETNVYKNQFPIVSQYPRVYIANSSRPENIYYVEFECAQSSYSDKLCYSTLRGYTDTGSGCEEMYHIQNIQNCDPLKREANSKLFILLIIILYFICNCISFK